jgi:hypothetical protein
VIDTAHPWADTARVLLNLLPGGVLLTLTILITAAYGRVYARYRREVAAGEVEEWRGLLPWHVVAVSLCLMVLLVATMAETWGRMGEPATPRILVYMVAYLLGVWSMVSVMGHIHYRWVSLPNHPWLNGT